VGYIESDGKFDGAFSYNRSSSHYSYVYDGLYLVDTMKIERVRYGKLVFLDFMIS